MIIRKKARETLTAVELDPGEIFEFELASGETRRIEFVSAWVEIVESTVDEPKVEKAGAVTNYRFQARFEIEGVSVTMVRHVSFQESFYEPRELFGMRIWLDAVQDIFEHLTEDHGECKPSKRVRFAVQDASLRICPVLLHPWCPLPEGGLRIEDCYNGEDVWLGAYFGAAAHGGLDINHPAGTPIWAPISFHDHELFDSLASGANNNRWRGFHRWPDGSEWVLQCHHVIRLRVPEHEPVEAGSLVADGAGVLTGSHEHSHFVWRVRDAGDAGGGEVMLDPWILFWQMYRDREMTGRG